MLGSLCNVVHGQDVTVKETHAWSTQLFKPIARFIPQSAQIVVDVLDMKRGQSASLHPSVASFTPPYVAKPTTTAVPGSIAMSTAV